MHRNLHLLSVLKRALIDDQINILPFTTHGVTTIRSYAGNIARTNIKPFQEMLDTRRDEAQRSVLVQVQSEQSCGDLFDYCSGYGAVNSMYHYQTPKNMHYVLVEMVSKPSAEELLKHTSHLDASQAIPVVSPFLWFKQTTVKKKIHKNNKKFNQDRFNLNCAIECDNSDSLLANMNKAKSISDQIKLFKEGTEISELGIRLRFLTARQIELGLSGLFRDICACPFGSSVNGFGRNGCDLDLLMGFPERSQSSSSRLVYHVKACSATDRLQIQNHIEVIGDIITCFMPGCVSVRKITQARVPIVKFRQELTNLDCDVSLYHASCLQMTEVLYLLEALDHRVKELVMAVRAWAKAVGLTNHTPGRWISNFSLTLLVLFFLQQPSVRILPPLQRLQHSSFIMTPEEFNQYASALSSHKSQNNASIEEILLQLFQFYSQYDFGINGLNLLSGKTVVKPDYSSMFIVNPVEPELNVSKNVSGDEAEKLRTSMRNAAWLLETKGQVRTDGEPWGFAKLLEHNTPSHSFSNSFHRSRSRLVDVKSLFDG